MKKYRILVGLLSFCIILFSLVNITFHRNKHGKSVFDYNQSVWYPYQSEDFKLALRSNGEENLQKNGLDYVNYYVVSAKAIKLIMDYKNTGGGYNIKDAEKILDRLEQTYDRCGNFPRPEYQNFPYGWVSSMDAPTIMLASQMMYEVTGNKRWDKFVKKLSEYVCSDVKNGGFTLYFKGSDNGQLVWPLEYANTESTVENSIFVLNGSLVGYLGILIMADVTEDEDLAAYAKQVKNTYKDYFQKYHYSNYDWSYYSLNPLTVNQPHYMIFEKQLFNAIKNLDGDSMIQNEIEYRENAFKSILEPQFKKIGSQTFFLIRRASAPHPYLIDIFQTRIEFLDKDNHVIETYHNDISGKSKNNKLRFQEDEFLAGAVPEEAVSYRIFAEKTADVEERLFEDDIAAKERKTVETYDILPDAFFDSKLIHSNEILISSSLSEKTEGRISYTFPVPVNCSQENYYGIELNNLSENTFGVGCILYDSKGNSVKRSYTKLLPGKNLILLSEIGFSGVDKMVDLKDIVLRIYTNNEREDSLISTGKVYIFNDLFELKDYQDKSEYTITPQ